MTYLPFNGIGLPKFGVIPIFYVLFICSFSVCFGQVQQGQAKWHSTLSGEFKAGNKRDISRMGFTFPISQTADSLTFLDFRGQVDDADNEEYNIGFVFRNLSAVDRIFGLYGYFDHKQTGFDNGFNQITFGAELLGEKWDLRANGYIPITGVQNVGLAPGNGNLAFVNDQLFINSQTVQESAYHGVDFEVGRLLTVFGENDNELRLYGGGFFFDSKESGYEQIAGPRARLEMRLFDVDLLGEGARVTFSGEVQYDDVRQTRGFAGIGVQIPLGRLSRGGIHSPGVSLHYRSMSRMERRMLDPVIRDVDIVTNTKLEGEAKELVNDAEGDPLFLADANYDIGNAIAKAGANGTVVVSGSIDTAGSNQLIDGQRITSVTTVQTVTGSLSGTKITSSLPGTQGVINGTDSTQAILLLADNVMIDSLQINGGANGIAAGGSVSGVTIDSNMISGAVQGEANTGNGFFVGGSFSGIVSNNSIQNNENDGIKIITNDGVIRGNVATLNGDEGIDLEVNNGAVAENMASANEDNGISIETNAGDVFGNTASLNEDNGISIETNAGDVFGNTASDNDDIGIFMGANEGFVTGNTLNRNGDSGLVAEGSSGTISANTTNMNVFVGVVVLDNTGVLTDNVATENGLAGYFVFDNGGLIAVNSATGNEVGFSIDRNLGFGLFSDNTATANIDFGFGNLINAETSNEGFFTDNVSNNNGGAGYHVLNTFGGISIGNTSSGNGAANTGGAVP